MHFPPFSHSEGEEYPYAKRLEAMVRRLPAAAPPPRPYHSPSLFSRAHLAALRTLLPAAQQSYNLQHPVFNFQG